MLDTMQPDNQLDAPVEPPPIAFLVGQDGEGHWLAVETHGFGGGLFVSRSGALRYARDESHNAPGAVRLADAPLRLFRR